MAALQVVARGAFEVGQRVCVGVHVRDRVVGGMEGRGMEGRGRGGAHCTGGGWGHGLGRGDYGWMGCEKARRQNFCLSMRRL